MKIKIPVILYILFTLISCDSFATINCPDISSIKKGSYQGWLPLNNLDDEPATPEEIVKFERTLKNFTGAEWSEDYQYGFARCNYNSKIEVSLASNNFPLYSRPYGPHWTWDGVVARCLSSSLFDCIFPSSWETEKSNKSPHICRVD